jgi:hypothetical protein
LAKPFSKHLQNVGEEELMERHIKILGVLNIVWGAMGALTGLLLLVIFGGAFGVVGTALHQTEATLAWPIVASIGGVIAGAITIYVLILSIPSIVAGIGLLNFKPWARIVGIVVSALHLMHIPFGTALGIYGLWVLVSRESESFFNGRLMHPTL